MPVCFQCGEDKPATEFYAHPQMKTGHLGKCKDCAKRYAYLKRLTDPSVREYDRVRAKRPERVAQSQAITTKHRKDDPLAYKARVAVGNAVRDGRLEKLPCEICGATQNIHGHHKDYARPLDVIWLCARCHHRLHALFPELEGANKRPLSA